MNSVTTRAWAIFFCACLCAVPTYASPSPRQGTAANVSGGKTRPELVVQLGHTGGVRCVTFSPDGSLVATGGLDGPSRLWEAATGREIRTFEGHASLVTSVAYSPNGRRIVTGSWDDTVRLWDVATGAQVGQVRLPSRVSSVAISPDVKTIAAACDDGQARLLDLKRGTVLRQLSGHTGPVESVAYSPDGRFVLTGSRDGTARLWDASTGAEVRRFAAKGGWVTAVAFSPDGRFVLAASGDFPLKGKNNVARLWDAATGRQVREFVGHEGRVLSVAVSPDGRRVLTGSDDQTARLWDAESGKELASFGALGDQVRSVAFSPDGRSALSACGLLSREGAVLWDVETHKQTVQFTGRSSQIDSVAVSPDGRFLMTVDVAGAASLWDTEVGARVERLAGYWTPITACAFLPDGRQAVIGGDDGTLGMWDTTIGAETLRFDGHTAAVSSVAFSPDGRFVFSVSLDGTARLWETATGALRLSIAHGSPAGIASISSDGTRVVTGGADGVVRLWNASTGDFVRSFEGHINTVTSTAFSRDGRLVLTGSKDSSVRLWDAESGAETRLFILGSGEIVSVAFGYDARSVVAGRRDGRVVILDAATGGTLRTYAFGSSLTSMVLTPDGRFAVAGCDDGTTRILDLASGNDLCRLVSFDAGGWAVVDAEGRFDSNALENLPGLFWVMADDPFRPRPIEIFMRDYYEPGLLRKRIKGSPLLPVRDLSSLDRKQPSVTITGVRAHEGQPGTVDVDVEVSQGAGDPKSGVYDVRLFRDGQLVGYAPGNEPASGDDEVGAWREATRVAVDGATGKATLTFAGVRLPQSASGEQVEFSAYAFNSDRVKSLTARKAFSLPQGLARSKGRAYVVSIGVNAYAAPALNLSYAADDARRLQTLVADRLVAAGEYEDVVAIPLISDYRRDGDSVTVVEALSTKANVKTVLDLLAGRPVDPAAVARIPGAERIRRTTPDDFVLITFSGHGLADRRGEFYLAPYDIVLAGEATVAFGSQGKDITHDAGGDAASDALAQALARCISSRELSAWLRDVDAGGMAMIIDACNSAASVESGGFKPGPMGNRGFGQLAYDKRMLVLAATQADNVALESGQIRQGLLTYSLLRDGLEAKRADFKPADGRIMLEEWLAYGARRVPSLYAEVKAGRILTATRPEPRILIHRPGDGVAQTEVRTEKVQEPVLFDFGSERGSKVQVETALTSDLGNYVGEYSINLGAGKYVYTITLEEGVLLIEPAVGTKRALVEVAPNTFVFADRRTVRISFDVDGRGGVLGFTLRTGRGQMKAVKTAAPPAKREGTGV